MSENHEGVEIIEGPGSLDEFLVEQSQIVMSEINKYKPDDKADSPLGRAGGRIYEDKKRKFAEIDEARIELEKGNKDPGLAILRKNIGDLKEGIYHNRRVGNDDVATVQEKILVAWQLLEEDEGGRRRMYLGTKGQFDSDEFRPKENVKRSDLVEASLFKILHSYETHVAMKQSYGNHVTSSESLIRALDGLFGYPNDLDEKDKGYLRKRIKKIMKSLSDFKSKNFTRGLDEAVFQTSGSKTSPQELLRIRDPYQRGLMPNGLVYMEDGGELKCRWAEGEENVSRVFDLEDELSNVKVDTIAKFGFIPQTIEEKLSKILKSSDFDARWQHLNPGAKLFNAYV